MSKSTRTFNKILGSNDNHEALPNTLFAFIWHFLREIKIIVAVFIFLAIIAGFWGPFNSILIKEVINLLPQAKNDDIAVLFFPAALIVLNFIVFDNVTWRGITYIRAKFAPAIVNHIIESSMNYVLRQSHQFFQHSLSGKLSKQIGNLAEGIEKLITSVFPNFLRGGSLLLVAFITAYFVNPVFFWTLIVWFFVFSSVSIAMSKKLVTLSEEQASSESTVVGELVDTISNQSNVKLFSRKCFEKIRMAPYFNNQQKAYYHTYFYSFLMHSIQGGLIAMMMSFSAYFLITLYSKDLVSIGDFALIFGLAMETGHMMWFTMSEVDEFNKAVGRCKQSLLILMKPLEIKDQANAQPLSCKAGEIQFKKVSFCYKDGKSLFDNKSINIRPGEKIGLVGYSGGGKSTFVNLILRLYDVTDGAIFIDGQDIREVTQDSLHENIAIIPQDPSLFQRSLMENIHYGNVNATKDEIIEAAKKAHAHEFITQLPQGYDSLVGERGIKLSGGQRQRIAIARAILKNAPILILDEATSQLDSVTESLIQDSLRELIHDKTTIIVAHRLSTLLTMDRILVFDQGKIVEDGCHNDLLKNKRLYKKLWDAQVGGFLGDKMGE